MKRIIRSEQNIQTARAMRESGATHQEIGNHFGTSEGTIRLWLDPAAYAKHIVRAQSWQKLNASKISARQRGSYSKLSREEKDRRCVNQRKRYATIPAVRERFRVLARQHRLTAQGLIAAKIRHCTLGYSNRFPLLFGSFMQAVTGLTRDEFTQRFAGEGQFDHIIPICAFDLTNPDHLVRCCHPSNLRLLPARQNQIKQGSKPQNLDIMAMAWIGTNDALVAAQNFISHHLLRLSQKLSKNNPGVHALPSIQEAPAKEGVPTLPPAAVPE